MNIFVLDEDPQKAAAYHNDKHCVKMILESTQILSTVMWRNNQKGPYKSTHLNHPCVIWAEQSLDNWNWLYDLLHYLSEEYTFRFNKIHKSTQIFHQLIPPMKNRGLTSFVQCMPDLFKIENKPVQAYRNYYMNEKRHIASWKTQIPEWWR